MFFWVQNGLLTPRLPEVSRPTVPAVTSLAEIHRLLPIDPETDAQTEANTRRIFPNPRTAYEEEKKEQKERSPLLFASQVMSTPVTTLDEDATVNEAKSLFLKLRFRHIPIINSKKQVVGIVSDRDVLKSVNVNSGFGNGKITEIMVVRVLTGNLQTEIRYAAKVMLDEKVGALPIVDPSGEILGIITRTDLIRAIVKFPGFTLLA